MRGRKLYLYYPKGVIPVVTIMIMATVTNVTAEVSALSFNCKSCIIYFNTGDKCSHKRLLNKCF